MVPFIDFVLKFNQLMLCCVQVLIGEVGIRSEFEMEHTPVDDVDGVVLPAVVVHVEYLTCLYPVEETI